MNWTKLGLVYCPSGRNGWDQHSALTPTPVVLDETRIRIFAGFRDETGVSRVGWFDVDSQDPHLVRAVSRRPALDIGVPGAFDDNGVILGDVFWRGNDLHMYYVGFQLVEKVKFLAFTGLAVSTNGGETFERVSVAPILDRQQDALFFNAIHSTIQRDDCLQAWCGVGSEFVQIGGGQYPSYNVRSCVSADGRTSWSSPRVVIDLAGDEYRIGRPRVIKTGQTYRMFFTVGTLRGTYLPGYAESNDAENWRRNDRDVGLTCSAGGWDSKSLSYIAPILVDGKCIAFYNGNDMGQTGVGVALLDSF